MVVFIKILVCLAIFILVCLLSPKNGPFWFSRKRQTKKKKKEILEYFLTSPFPLPFLPLPPTGVDEVFQTALKTGFSAKGAGGKEKVKKGFFSKLTGKK